MKRPFEVEMWRGQRLDEMTKEELIDVIRSMAWQGQVRDNDHARTLETWKLFKELRA